MNETEQLLKQVTDRVRDSARGRVGDGGSGPGSGPLSLRQPIGQCERGRASDRGRPEGVLSIADGTGRFRDDLSPRAEFSSRCAA
ncbi:hypothetical protein [Streptomyces sp. WAC07061]|uniref:hypothetical protein n=1 Tax=Streptomyces sp. WAC07061 TaxID=2487410 RepID=UPI00163D1CE2|nr:hypothetical protein [Streptomyces sp. WAC07061]